MTAKQAWLLLYGAPCPSVIEAMRVLPASLVSLVALSPLLVLANFHEDAS